MSKHDDNRINMARTSRLPIIRNRPLASLAWPQGAPGKNSHLHHSIRPENYARHKHFAPIPAPPKKTQKTI